MSPSRLETLLAELEEAEAAPEPQLEPQISKGQEMIARMAEPNPMVARDLDEQAIIHSRTRSEAAYNAFRELRTELFQRAGNRNFVVLVTSAVSGGGATHVAVNLASAIAFDKTKTALLIDCNVYRPGVHKVLQLDPNPGLTDFLADPEKVRIERIIRPTGIPRVRAIPAGSRPARDAEYFSTVNMRLLVHMLHQRYPDRHIVIDAPACKSAADTRTLEGLSDQVLVVVPYGRVTSSKIQDACRSFDPDKLAGVVFNRQPQIIGA